MQLKIEQGSQEWLELRKSKITATDSPIIMEVSPWKTPYQLWLNKIGQSPDSPQTEAMRRGLTLEDEARSKFEKTIGMSFSPKVVISDEVDWMMASLDGMSESGKEIVEIKCPGHEDHSAATRGLVPSKYYPQLQHQIAVCGVKMAYYFSYDGSYGALIEVERDDQYIKKMMECEKDFYECLTDFVPPKLTERDFICREDDEWEYCALLWREAAERRKKYEEEETTYRKRLIEMSQGKNTRGCGVSVSKYVRKGNIEYRNIPGIELLDIEKGRKSPIEVWRISE